MNSLRSVFTKNSSPTIRVVLFARGLKAEQFISTKLSTIHVKHVTYVQLEWTMHVDEVAQAESAFRLIYHLHKTVLPQLSVNLNLIGADDCEVDMRLYWKHALANCDEFAPLDSSNRPALFQVRMGATLFKEVLNELCKKGEKVKWFASSPTQQQKAKLAATSIVATAKIMRRRIHLQL